MTVTFLIAVVLGSPKSGRDGESPFAHIVAMEPTEALSKRARRCIHVFAERDTLVYRDGVLAVAKECAVLNPHIHWPMLVRALNKPVKAFEGLINTSPGQPPHQRLKNYVEDGFTCNAAPDGEDGYATTALELMTSWNEWNSENTTMENRAIELHGAVDWNSWILNIRDSKIDLLRKFCGELGLRVGQDIDISHQRTELENQLLQARSIYQKVYGQ